MAAANRNHRSITIFRYRAFRGMSAVRKKIRRRTERAQQKDITYAHRGRHERQPKSKQSEQMASPGPHGRTIECVAAESFGFRRMLFLFFASVSTAGGFFADALAVSATLRSGELFARREGGAGRIGTGQSN